jgi:hypothetical protein
VSDVPWWGWALIVVLAIIIVPIKIRILKKIFGKKEQEEE